MRTTLFDILKALYPTYYVGQHKGEAKGTYLVIQLQNYDLSSENSGSGWQYFDIMIYVPSNSIVKVDEAVESIITAFKVTNYELVGGTPDFYDDIKKAYMRSLKFRVPSGLF